MAHGGAEASAMSAWERTEIDDGSGITYGGARDPLRRKEGGGEGGSPGREVKKEVRSARSTSRHSRRRESFARRGGDDCSCRGSHHAARVDCAMRSERGAGVCGGFRNTRPREWWRPATAVTWGLWPARGPARAPSTRSSARERRIPSLPRPAPESRTGIPCGGGSRESRRRVFQQKKVVTSPAWASVCYEGSRICGFILRHHMRQRFASNP